MDWISNALESVQAIADAGGVVIYVILSLALLLWMLILERYWFFLREHPKNLVYCVEIWKKQKTNDWIKRKIHDELVSELSLALQNRIGYIKTLIALCPLLGLLGTVIGMINLFDVLAITGTGNARAMSDTISQATIPTMAGMVVALSGLYFSVDLARKAKNESFRLREDFS